MINGNQLRDAMISAAYALDSVKQDVDALNVFPVPDGDTGTNMSMTMTNAARELSRLTDPTVTQVADTASSALLRGARGNSGVILSLIFRGFAKGLKEKEEADGAALAAALILGQEAAYKAVMKPTEGTILTVAREAAEAAKAAAATESDPVKVWDAVCAKAEDSLAHTPDLLPQLKKAGVVDAGGKGLCIIFGEMARVFNGGEAVKGAGASKAAVKKETVGNFEQDIRFAYCTEFIVKRGKACTRDPLALRAFLESIGDCAVLVDDDDIIKVHVHTNHPGQVLEQALQYGAFETVKIENMRIQHENAGWVEEAAADAAADPIPERVEPEKPYGFVAVAAGDGLKALFSGDLGCDQVVSGGQTMNPSTDDILNAIEATPAQTVFVLPNNKNIILAAEQAVPLADRRVCVLPTRTVPQGVSAILAFDESAGVEENIIAMQKAADNVSTGSLTFAARDSDYEGHKIKEGQILALENGKLSFVDTELNRAVAKLIRTIANGRRAAGKEVNFISLAYGEGVTEAEAQAVADTVRAKVGGDPEVSVFSGGQPVYYYIISIE